MAEQIRRSASPLDSTEDSDLTLRSHDDARGDGQQVPVVDVHAHAMPLPLLRDLESQGLADLSDLSGSVVTLDSRVSGLPTGAKIPCPREQFDVESRLSAMDEKGIDVAAVSAPPFLFCTTADDEDFTLDVVRRSNDGMVDFVREVPERFLALGTVPVGSPHAVDEARRCLDDLGCVGLAIGSFGLQRELDDPVNEELWTFAADRGAFLLLHPSRVSGVERLDKFHLPQLLGYPAETALAVSRMIFGGVLDRHDLSLCLSHGGGCLPSIKGRLDLGWERKEVARTTKHAPSRYLRRLYFDSAVFEPVMLRRLIEDVGVHRVLLGTDSPFDLEEQDPLEFLDSAGLSGSDFNHVAGGNAQSLLGMKQAAFGGSGHSGRVVR